MDQRQLSGITPPRISERKGLKLGVDKTSPLISQNIVTAKAKPIGKAEIDEVAQRLHREKLAGNALTNFIHNMNSDNEEYIDQGHAPSWVLEKSAKNLANKALTTGNKKWLDLIGKVDTYGGGNYAQTQKGRKIIRDTINEIERKANESEDREYKRRSRGKEKLKHGFTVGFNRVLGMEEGPEKEALIKKMKEEAFTNGLSDVYQNIYRNYDLINEREGEPTVLSDKAMMPKILEWINEPGNFGTFDTMTAGVTTFLAENNIKVNENQQSKIDKLLKAYTPLEGINEFKELSESIDKFGEDYLKKLSINAKFVPDQARTASLDQRANLIKRFRKVLNEHRLEIKGKEGQYVPYGLWSTEQKNELYQDLLTVRNGYLDTARTEIKKAYDENTPTPNDAKTNAEYNKVYTELGTLNYLAGTGTSLTTAQEERRKNLELELKYKWPKKWDEHRKSEIKRDEPEKDVISFAKDADPEHTQAIRDLLAEYSFETPEYMQMKVDEYTNKNKIKPDTEAQAEIDRFKQSGTKLDEIPTTKDSLDLFDKLLTSIFPGYQPGLMALKFADVVKRVPTFPMQAFYMIRENRKNIKDAIKGKLKAKILGEKGEKGLNVPYGALWSDQQREDFNKESDAEIMEEFLKEDSKIIKDLKALSPDKESTKDKPEEIVEMTDLRLKEAFPNYKDSDLSNMGETLANDIKSITDNSKMREIFIKILPTSKIPKSIEERKKLLLTEIVKHYTLLKQIGQ